jgi:hypothetical protein
MMLKTFFLIFAILAFSGCTKTVYVDRVKYVDIPVKCRVPSVECSTQGKNDVEIVSEMIRCIYDLKEAAKVCK